ncbi:MAG: helix-hairpin-helix domain-containing protein [Candidatus Omnitrophica bacterium]|nr:helix-hairpin-helix domain-containing protein [Candidatus Omnitrophota bacterium]
MKSTQIYSFLLAAVLALVCQAAPVWAAKPVQELPAQAGVLMEKININTADNTALQQIRGVGPKMAERIIAYRNETGRFQKPEELINVTGIGPAKYERLKDQITV